MLVAMLMAFTVTVIVEPFLIRLLIHQQVVDVPNHRSSHDTSTPRGGGAGVIAGSVVGILIAGDRIAIILLAGILGAAAIGAFEDVRGIRIVSRLVLTTLVSALLILALLMSDPRLSVWIIGLLGIPWTVAVINAFNFMDGIDGISAATAVVGGSAYALLGIYTGLYTLTVIGGVIAAACSGFAPFNVPKARVFLGDVGSYGLGVAFAALSLLAFSKGIPVAACVAPLGLYLADTGSTIMFRIRAGEPFYLPHKSHTYQRLVACGMSHTSVSALVGLLTALCCCIGAVIVFGDAEERLVATVLLGGVLCFYLYLPRAMNGQGTNRSNWIRRHFTN